jgi:TPR repeat protein
MKKLHLLCVAGLSVLSLSADVPTRLATPPERRLPAKTRQSEADADYLRGVRLAQGEGVKQDYAEAAKFYRRAAEKGHAPAQYWLAFLYEHGLGVELDFKQAAAWYLKAALQGYLEAQNNLGVLYATGRGVPKNNAEAVRWYRRAAEQDDPEGMSNLAITYLQGRGVKRDPIQAFQWMRKRPRTATQLRKTILLSCMRTARLSAKTMFGRTLGLTLLPISFPSATKCAMTLARL